MYSDDVVMKSPPRSNRGDIDGKWEHDMFNKHQKQGSRKRQSPRGGGGFRVTVPAESAIATFIISNLAIDINEKDVEELLDEFHLSDCAVRDSGENEREAEVKIPREEVKKLKNFVSSIELDGRKLTLAEVSEPVRTSVFSRITKVSNGGSLIARNTPPHSRGFDSARISKPGSSNHNSNSNSRRDRRGFVEHDDRRNNQRGRQNKSNSRGGFTGRRERKTEAELDADLEAYMNRK